MAGNVRLIINPILPPIRPTFMTTPFWRDLQDFRRKVWSDDWASRALAEAVVILPLLGVSGELNPTQELRLLKFLWEEARSKPPGVRATFVRDRLAAAMGETGRRGKQRKSTAKRPMSEDQLRILEGFKRGLDETAAKWDRALSGPKKALVAAKKKVKDLGLCVVNEFMGQYAQAVTAHFFASVDAGNALKPDAAIAYILALCPETVITVGQMLGGTPGLAALPKGLEWIQKHVKALKVGVPPERVRQRLTHERFSDAQADQVMQVVQSVHSTRNSGTPTLQDMAAALRAYVDAQKNYLDTVEARDRAYGDRQRVMAEGADMIKNARTPEALADAEEAVAAAIKRAARNDEAAAQVRRLRRENAPELVRAARSSLDMLGRLYRAETTKSTQCFPLKAAEAAASREWEIRARGFCKERVPRLELLELANRIVAGKANLSEKKALVAEECWHGKLPRDFPVVTMAEVSARHIVAAHHARKCHAMLRALRQQRLAATRDVERLRRAAASSARHAVAKYKALQHAVHVGRVRRAGAAVARAIREFNPVEKVPLSAGTLAILRPWRTFVRAHRKEFNAWMAGYGPMKFAKALAVREVEYDSFNLIAAFPHAFEESVDNAVGSKKLRILDTSTMKGPCVGPWAMWALGVSDEKPKVVCPAMEASARKYIEKNKQLLENLKTWLETTKDASSGKLAYFTVNILLKKSMHANACVVDPVTRKMYYFEPHSKQEGNLYRDKWATMDAVAAMLGLQLVYAPSGYKLQGYGLGWCVSWSFYFIGMMAANLLASPALRTADNAVVTVQEAMSFGDLLQFMFFIRDPLDKPWENFLISRKNLYYYLSNLETHGLPKPNTDTLPPNFTSTWDGN